MPRTTLYGSEILGFGTTTCAVETADPCKNGPNTGDNPLQKGELIRDWTAQTSAVIVQSLGNSRKSKIDSQQKNIVPLKAEEVTDKDNYL